MYVFLGWLNIALIAIMTAPFWLRFLNDRTLHLKGGTYGKAIKLLRKVHKPLGSVILLIGLFHAYLAWGSFRVHTGTFLWLSILITAILGGSFYATKKKHLFVWHKRMVLVAIFFLIVHVLFPNAVSLLM